MFLRAAVFCVYVSVSLADLAIAPLQPKPEKYKNSQGCYIEDLDAVIPFSRSAPSKKYCLEYRCSQMDVEVAGCGVVLFDNKDRPDCYLIEDTTKPYPECCPAIKCSKA